MDNLKEICLRLKNKRTEKKLTVRKLAEKSGVSRSLVSNYELGNVKNYSIDNLKAIANVLGVTVEWIMGWEDSRTHISYNADIIIIISDGKPININLSESTDITIKGKEIKIYNK